jgi:transposase InsO family protein
VVAFALGHPGFGPARIAAELARPNWGGIVLSTNGVWRVLRRHGLNTRAKRYGLVAGYAAPPEPQRPTPAPERHLQVDHPGELVQRPAQKVAADLAARGWRLERVMSDNASEFRATVFGQVIAELGARHSFIRAGRPQTNGCVERVQQTILDECWKPAFARYLIPKQTGLRLDLERYLRYYNTERAHTGRWTRGRTPEEVLGKAKLWHKKR